MNEISQIEFEKRFTKPEFTAFLENLDTQDVQVKSYTNCFIAKFVKTIWPDASVQMGFYGFSVNGKTFMYPEWSKPYLEYLERLTDPNSKEFSVVAKRASLEFLQ
jgi:hypothetical protein